MLGFAYGRSLYHTGDTWIFSDMALIQELYHTNIISLNAGGGPYTQDPPTAALAVKKYFSLEVIVPMPFGTFPPQAKEADVPAAFAGDPRFFIMKAGQSKSFQAGSKMEPQRLTSL